MPHCGMYSVQYKNKVLQKFMIYLRTQECIISLLTQIKKYNSIKKWIIANTVKRIIINHIIFELGEELGYTNIMNWPINKPSYHQHCLFGTQAERVFPMEHNPLPVLQQTEKGVEEDFLQESILYKEGELWHSQNHRPTVAAHIF